MSISCTYTCQDFLLRCFYLLLLHLYRSEAQQGVVYIDFNSQLAYFEHLQAKYIILRCPSSELYTSDKLIVQHELKRSRKLTRTESAVMYHIPKLSCSDFGRYTCRSREGQHEKLLDLSVTGCSPQMCSSDYTKQSANIGYTARFDICVYVPAPRDPVPLMVFYKYRWLKATECVLLTCVNWTVNRTSIFRFDVTIYVFNVSLHDYGNTDVKFGALQTYKSNFIIHRLVLTSKGNMSGMYMIRMQKIQEQVSINSVVTISICCLFFVALAVIGVIVYRVLQGRPVEQNPNIASYGDAIQLA
ncbi:uncharacterized protein LOC131942002 isoform X2 [Physella acuta]|uniref:uncharacterized protein LOC131942002 isoform X2 n=1 Tax=Physella acuta TaxID=109671 RepID=UPI0027DBE2DF|nr:uncharacterized protein LOC131942002 isoform X2 [Physella acuta]